MPPQNNIHEHARTPKTADVPRGSGWDEHQETRGIRITPEAQQGRSGPSFDRKVGLEHPASTRELPRVFESEFRRLHGKPPDGLIQRLARQGRRIGVPQPTAIRAGPR